MLNCARCSALVEGQAVQTPMGWMHPQCAGAPVGAVALPRVDDNLSEGWKIALYAAALIPWGSWFVVLGSSVLYYAWRKETPNKAAQINKHGWLAWLLGMAVWGAIWFLMKS
ncbi:MAG: hypothetical protein K0R38_5170 [Polyangiaceae bacterium]|jgi:hypothetical protein|nr:hypothetical protein [Polyangiaceae bacterium]